MATKKITDLPAAVSLALTDLLEAVDMTGPTSKKATLSVIKTALGIAAGDATAESNAVATSAAAIVTERTATRTLTGATIAGASNTLSVRIANDVTGLAAGAATWLTTPSSANLLAMLSDETGSGLCVFGTAPTFKTTISLRNPADTFSYIFTPAAIAANRTVTLPLLTGNDTLVAEAHTQTLTNKTIAGASNTLTVRIANDVTGLGTNVATFLGTPSGANLAAALTSALPVSKGGTGLTALTIPASALLVGTTDTQTLTNKTLTTPTVTSTVINNATSGGTINNCTLSGSAGTVIRLRFTDAVGPTVTGFDVTTVSGGAVTDGTILRVTAVGGTVAFNHENASSTAANRITCGGLTINLPTGSHVDFEYDGTSQRWRAGAGTGI